jgi:hypothetical protein
MLNKINNIKIIKFLILLNIFIFKISYSQNKNIECNKIVCNTNYYKIRILKENNHPFFINLIGIDVNFDDLPKESLQNFINNIYTKNKFTPIIMNTEYYYKYCEIKLNSKKVELMLKSKINNMFINNKVFLKKQIFLESGEQIDITGVSIKGMFLVIDNNKLNFQNISLYPEEIYDCKEINEYYIPIKIF